MSCVFPWCIFTHLPVPSSVPVDPNVRQQVAQRLPSLLSLYQLLFLSSLFCEKRKCTKEQSHIVI